MKSNFIIDGNVLIKYVGKLKNVEVPNGVEEIGYRAFYNMPIKSVKLPSSVKKIGKIAFAFCDNLTTVDMPDSVEFIESDAFEDSYPTLKIVKGSYTNNYVEENELDFEIK